MSVSIDSVYFLRITAFIQREGHIIRLITHMPTTCAVYDCQRANALKFGRDCLASPILYSP